MIITTSGQVEGKTIAKTIGLVKGSTIRARHLGRDIMAGLRGMVGGDLPGNCHPVFRAGSQPAGGRPP